MVIGLSEDVAQSGVDKARFGYIEQPSVGLNTPIFADSKEDDPVNCPLHGKIEFPNGQSLITSCDILCQYVAPTLNFNQELFIDLCGALLFTLRLRKCV